MFWSEPFNFDFGGFHFANKADFDFREALGAPYTSLIGAPMRNG